MLRGWQGLAVSELSEDEATDGSVNVSFVLLDLVEYSCRGRIIIESYMLRRVLVVDSDVHG